MSDPAIHLAGVKKNFGAKQVLRGVDLEIAPGECCALLGRNGAGKTTLMRLLLGLIKRDAGEISVLSRDPAREPIGIRAAVGFLAEDQQMFGWMTVAEILAFTAPFYPDWDQSLADRLVSDFELPATTRVGHLSKGQNVRLGLVLALAHRPRVVILDDPALGLDPIMRKDFNRDLITHLQGEGAMVLYSSHLLYEVEPIADTVAILKDGVIVKREATEVLRQEVKQLILAPEAFAAYGHELVLLDVQRQRGEVAATVEKAPAAIARLQGSGTMVRVVDLNLDDIFAAYVAGRPETPAPAAAVAV